MLVSKNAKETHLYKDASLINVLYYRLNAL